MNLMNLLISELSTSRVECRFHANTPLRKIGVWMTATVRIGDGADVCVALWYRSVLLTSYQHVTNLACITTEALVGSLGGCQNTRKVQVLYLLSDSLHPSRNLEYRQCVYH